MAITGTLQEVIQLVHTSALDLSTPSENVITPSSYPSWTVADGSGADQMDIIWHDQRTLAAGTPENLDLSGSLTDAYGTTMNFAIVKLIMVASASANDGLIQVGGAGSNTFVNWVANSSDILNVRNGGALMLFAPDATGYAVTAGTGDILKINNSGASSGVYDIVIGGVSA